MEGKEIHNHFEKDSNCQVFNGPVSGCVFAMPGSVVNQHPNTPNQEPTDDGAEKGEREQAEELHETIINELHGIFYDTEKAGEFIRKASVMKDTDICLLVRRMVREKVISELSCRKPLWDVLHKHGIYKTGIRNWNKHI